MATAIKAIPTLHVEDAIRFREEMEANERAFLSRTKRDFCVFQTRDCQTHL